MAARNGMLSEQASIARRQDRQVRVDPSLDAKIIERAHGLVKRRALDANAGKSAFVLKGKKET